MGRWIEVEHTADLSLHVWGQDLADFFATAALGMFALVADAAPHSGHVIRKLALNAPDVETLLVDWLNELLYLYETEDAVFVGVQFEHVSTRSLSAEVRGTRPVERFAYIKAATFHNLAVTQGPGGWEAELVFDV